MQRRVAAIDTFRVQPFSVLAVVEWHLHAGPDGDILVPP